MPERNNPVKTLTPSILIAGVFVAHLLSVVYFAVFFPVTGDILGRYDLRYAIGLILIIGFALGWLGSFLYRQPTIAWLTTHSLWARVGILGIYAAFLVLIWLIGRSTFRNYLILSWFLAVWVLLFVLPDDSGVIPWLARLKWIFIVVLIFFIVVYFVTSMTLPSGFWPDEAVWFDGATTSFVDGQLGFRTTLRTDYPVMPGIGWSVGAYGWTLEHISLSVYTGRIWILGSKLIAILAIGGISRRLYGGKAALISMGFATFASLMAGHEYRPHFLLPAVVMIATFAAVQAHYSRGRWRYVWHWVCGLVATFAIQIHIIGVIYAFSFSFFYLMEFVWTSYRQRRWANLWPLVTFASAALLGVLGHYWFNVRPLGGYDAYLDFLFRLNQHQPVVGHVLDFHWNATLGRALAWLGIVFVMWRHNRADRLFLSIFTPVLLFAVLLDRQGYFEVHSAFYAIPFGACILSSLPATKMRAQYGTALAIVLLSGLMLGQSIDFISWPNVLNWLKTGALPSPYAKFVKLADELTQNDLTDDDIIVSTSQLLWGMPKAQNLVALYTEMLAATRGYPVFESSLDIWEHVQPTVIVFVSDGEFIAFLPRPYSGLLDYVQIHDFQECHKFYVEDLEVGVYRQVCDISVDPSG